MKNIFAIYGLLLFSLVGCGENNNGYYNANSCQAGYSMINGSCVMNNGYNSQYGYNTGMNGYPMNGALPQGCTTGYIWNGSTCIPQTSNVAGVAVAVAPTTQNCSNGQYFNGANCAATLAYQGACPSGQINTSAYGCIQTASQCQNQYSYLNGSSCVPAQVTLPSCSACQNSRIRRSGRIAACSSTSGTPKKIKFNKDGSVKKIVW